MTLVTSSCGGIPRPPIVELCSLDPENGVAYCSKSKKVKNRNSIKEIDDMGKWIAVSPQDWGAILKYIKTLKAAIKKKLLRK